MKKTKKLWAAMIFAVMMVAGMGFTAFAASNEMDSEYTKVQVAQVEDITDLLGADNSGAINKMENIDGEGLFSYYYTFTLKKTSYVNVKSYAKLVDANYQADMNIYLSTDKVFAEGPIIKSWMNGEGKEYRDILEAGTYYIKVCCDLHDNPGFTNERTVNFAIYTQPVKRSSSKGGSMAKALSIKGTTPGCITKTTKKQWFKVNVSEKSDVKFNTIISSPAQWNEGKGYVCAYDKNGAMLSKKFYVSTKEGNSTAIELKGVKGTVYVCVEAESGVFDIVQTVSVKDNYKPDAPSVSTLKKGAKYVTGKGEANTTVIVKYNGKTYKGKVDKKGKFKVAVATLKSKSTVKVSLTDAAGNTSSAKTVKVK